MATLYLERSSMEIEVENETIVLRENGTLLQRIPCRLVDRIVVTADLSLQVGALRRLGRAGIGVFLPASRSGADVLLWPAETRAGTRKLGQARIYMDARQRQAWAARVVRGKVQGQMGVLRALESRRPEKGFELAKGREQLSGALGRLRGGALEIPSLLGVEGAASAAYFQAFGCAFAPGLHFRGRTRRPPRDPVNAVLSLGYTLLYHGALEAILAAGLEPSFGFLHEPAPGRSALACDLMEPFRPKVDWEIWKMWNERVLRAESFSVNQGACLLGKAGRRNFYGAFEAPMDAMRGDLRSVCTAFGRAAEIAAAVQVCTREPWAGSEWREEAE